MLPVLIFAAALLQTSLAQSEKFARNVNEKKTRSIADGWHNQYHNLNKMVEKLKEMNSTFANVDLFSIGKSAQHRDMYAIKISGNRTENKPVFFVQCLIHGNDWITGSTCMYLADKISSQYGLDSAVTEMLDKMDFVILPVMNVDGYHYSRTYSSNTIARNWPKSRRRVTFRGSCYGVDLDRNFGYYWGSSNPWDESIEPCKNTYRGPYAFSESETRNVNNYLHSLGGNLKGFIDFQDNGRREWQMPWQYTYTVTPDHDEQKRAAVEAAKAIRKVGYGDSYQSCCQAAYSGKFGGTSLDYVYGRLKVKYSYKVSMREQRGHLFVNTAKGILEGVKALVKAMQL